MMTISDERLQDMAHAFKYPSTPDISRVVRVRLTNTFLPPSGQESQVRQALFMPWHSWRNWASLAVKGWVLRKTLRGIVILLMVLMIVLFAVPQTRAALVGFFRVGVVRILPTAPPTTTTAPRPITTPDSTLPPALQGLSGRTLLENLRGYTLFKIKLPTYPPDLGAPDYVFNQTMLPMVVFAWRDPNDPYSVRLSLYEIAADSPIVTKIEPRIVQETTVNGQYALWVEGDYLLQLTNGNFDLRRTVSGYTLVWEEEGVTYRLETNLPLEEARKIAESLK